MLFGYVYYILYITTNQNSGVEVLSVEDGPYQVQTSQLLVKDLLRKTVGRGGALGTGGHGLLLSGCGRGWGQMLSGRGST